MAGHSKWANIKHRKAAQDKKRGKVFTKLIRELTVAARAGGKDAGSNPRLRAAIDKALSNNMTRDTIDRAVKRGAGELDDTHYEEIRYEGYGPSGTAILVECLTDNRNRTVSEVRHAFNKHGGNLGTDGSVAYLFTKQGILSYPDSADEENLMEAALESGAEDIISNDDGTVDVITSPERFGQVKDQLEQAGFKTENAEVSMEASTKVVLDKDGAEKFMRLFDVLEDLDDVQEVYSNVDIPDDILQQL